MTMKQANYLMFDATGAAIGSGFTPDGTFPAGSVECTADQAAAPKAWQLVDGEIVAASAGVLAAQVLAGQAAALLAGPVTITSTSTPALDGSYSIAAQDQQHIAVEVQSLMLNGTFADGTSSVQWPDATGALHTFDAGQFKAFAAAVGAFVAACIKCSIGTSTTVPSNSLTIA